MAGVSMAMNQTNYALIGKESIGQYFVYNITIQLVACLLKKANGAVFSAITTRDFSSEKIIIPQYSIIENFCKQVASNYERILINDCENKKLIQLRDSLLLELMNGDA